MKIFILTILLLTGFAIQSQASPLLLVEESGGISIWNMSPGQWTSQTVSLAGEKCLTIQRNNTELFILTRKASTEFSSVGTNRTHNANVQWCSPPGRRTDMHRLRIYPRLFRSLHSPGWKFPLSVAESASARFDSEGRYLEHSAQGGVMILHDHIDRYAAANRWGEPRSGRWPVAYGWWYHDADRPDQRHGMNDIGCLTMKLLALRNDSLLLRQLNINHPESNPASVVLDSLEVSRESTFRTGSDGVSAGPELGVVESAPLQIETARLTLLPGGGWQALVIRDHESRRTFLIDANHPQPRREDFPSIQRIENPLEKDNVFYQVDDKKSLIFPPAGAATRTWPGGGMVITPAGGGRELHLYSIPSTPATPGRKLLLPFTAHSLAWDSVGDLLLLREKGTPLSQWDKQPVLTRDEQCPTPDHLLEISRPTAKRREITVLRPVQLERVKLAREILAVKDVFTDADFQPDNEPPLTLFSERWKRVAEWNMEREEWLTVLPSSRLEKPREIGICHLLLSEETFRLPLRGRTEVSIQAMPADHQGGLLWQLENPPEFTGDGFNLHCLPRDLSGDGQPSGLPSTLIESSFACRWSVESLRGEHWQEQPAFVVWQVGEKFKSSPIWNTRETESDFIPARIQQVKYPWLFHFNPKKLPDGKYRIRLKVYFDWVKPGSTPGESTVHSAQDWPDAKLDDTRVFTRP